jgi:hypothetical protein
MIWVGHSLIEKQKTGFSFSEARAGVSSPASQDFLSRLLTLLENWYRVPLRPAVAHLVEVLRYKPESHEFESRWCHWDFSLT